MEDYQEPRVGRPPKSDEEKMDQPFRCLGIITAFDGMHRLLAAEDAVVDQGGQRGGAEPGGDAGGVVAGLGPFGQQ